MGSELDCRMAAESDPVHIVAGRGKTP